MATIVKPDSTSCKTDENALAASSQDAQESDVKNFSAMESNSGAVSLADMDLPSMSSLASNYSYDLSNSGVGKKMQDLIEFGINSSGLRDLTGNIPNIGDLEQVIPNLEDLKKDIPAMDDLGNVDIQALSNFGRDYIPGFPNLNEIGESIPGFNGKGVNIPSLDDFGKNIPKLENLGKNVPRWENLGKNVPKWENLGKNIPSWENFGKDMGDFDLNSITDTVTQVGNTVESLTGVSPSDLVSQIPGAELFGFTEDDKGDGSSSDDSHDFESIFSDLQSIGGDFVEIVADSKQFFTQLGALVGVFGTLVNTSSNILEDYRNGHITAGALNVILLISIQIPTISAMLVVFLKDKIQLTFKGFYKVKEDLKELVEDLQGLLSKEEEEESDNEDSGEMNNRNPDQDVTEFVEKSELLNNMNDEMIVDEGIESNEREDLKNLEISQAGKKRKLASVNSTKLEQNENHIFDKTDTDTDTIEKKKKADKESINQDDTAKAKRRNKRKHVKRRRKGLTASQSTIESSSEKPLPEGSKQVDQKNKSCTEEPENVSQVRQKKSFEHTKEKHENNELQHVPSEQSQKFAKSTSCHRCTNLQTHSTQGHINESHKQIKHVQESKGLQHCVSTGQNIQKFGKPSSSHSSFSFSQDLHASSRKDATLERAVRDSRSKRKCGEDVKTVVKLKSSQGSAVRQRRSDVDLDAAWVLVTSKRKSQEYKGNKSVTKGVPGFHQLPTTSNAGLKNADSKD